MSKRSTLNRWICVLAVLLASCAVAQERSANLHQHDWRGTWMATAGPAHSFRGRWWASLLPNTHNAASGSWTLLSDTNQILLDGTWTSDMTDVTDKTFEEMLNRTMEKQVSGSWRSGRMQGNWWLQGLG